MREFSISEGKNSLVEGKMKMPYYNAELGVLSKEPGDILEETTKKGMQPPLGIQGLSHQVSRLADPSSNLFPCVFGSINAEKFAFSASNFKGKLAESFVLQQLGSIFQCRDGHDKHSVGALVGGFGKAAENHQSSGRLTVGTLDVIVDLQQLLCGIVNLMGTQFDFNGIPASVRQFQDGIDFIVVIVLIMI